MNTDLAAMYRIMILFMLNRVEFPLTNTQITNLVLDKDYMDYFTVQQVLLDLVSTGLILTESTHSNTRYRLTDEGRETLNFFADRVSDDIKKEISDYFREHHYDLKQETSIYADYYKTPQNNYGVRCQIKNTEHTEKTVLDLTVFVDTMEQARAICGNWQDQCREVYAILMDALLK